MLMDFTLIIGASHVNLGYGLAPHGIMTLLKHTQEDLQENMP